MSPESRAALKKLFADNQPVCISTPYTADDIGWMWVSIGQVAIQNPAKFIAYPDRYVTYPYEEITQPDSDTVLQWSFDDMAEAFPSFTAMAAAYADFDDMKLDIRS
jgi:hypothetical protein